MKCKSRPLRSIESQAMALLTASALGLALSGCGGGDGAAASAPAAVAAPAPVPVPGPATPTSVLAAACSNCGAVDANTYSGAGAGIWQSINDGSAVSQVPISISGLQENNTVTLVFTNQTAQAQPMPSIALTVKPFSPSAVVASALRLKTDAEIEKASIGAFNRDGWEALAVQSTDSRRLSVLAAPVGPAINDTRTWYHSDNSARSATLVRQGITSDGTTVNLWVESGEIDPAKISPAILDAFVASFVPAGKIYDMLKSIGGPVWGANRYSNLVASSGQPIDIVVLNFDYDGKPFGTVGYFFGRNNVLRDSANPYSNESVSLYLDSETAYLGGAAGMQSILMTMAHEGMHMQNFYRRGVLHGSAYSFDTWLEEGSAMMMEDFASHTIDPTYNAIRDERFPNYIARRIGSYNCSLTNWTPFGDACESYSVSGSLGGFLDRQLGLVFYKNLLTNFSSTDSVSTLDAAIRSVAPTSSLVEQLRRFAATSGALIPVGDSPPGFGFPARVEGGFTVPAIDPMQMILFRTVISTVPATLQPYGSLPVVREGISGTFAETISVPPHSALSVVIY